MTIARSRVLAAPALVLSAFVLTTCGSDAPTTPPTPSASLLPAATPAPTPQTPCKALGFGPGNGQGCPRPGQTFLMQVDQAIDEIGQQHPEIFDFNNQVGGGGWYVRSPGRYYVYVLKNLENKGLCAGYDGEEIWVKSSNNFNDQFHILISSGFVRRGDSSYRATCFPAAWPQPTPAPPPTPGCSLPPSRELVCAREESSQFLPTMLDVIQTLQQKRPELFDGNNIRDMDAYHAAVVAELSSRGFCARYDGEEIAMKNTSEFSEQFKIDLSSGKIRADDGTYRASCYPAAF